jgi:hypothetical protein
MAAGDTLTSFTDMSTSPYDPTLYDQYFGLTDTGLGFTGSTTMQNVQLGAPIPLDTSLTNVPDASVTDLLPQVPTLTSSWVPTGADIGQSLSGASDVPPNSVAASAQTNTPNVTDASQNSANALGALGKLGSSLASLFGGAPRLATPTYNRTATMAGGSLAPTAAFNSGSFTLVTIIILGTLIFLLLRSE